MRRTLRTPLIPAIALAGAWLAAGCILLVDEGEGGGPASGGSGGGGSSTSSTSTSQGGGGITAVSSTGSGGGEGGSVPACLRAVTVPTEVTRAQSSKLEISPSAVNEADLYALNPLLQLEALRAGMPTVEPVATRAGSPEPLLNAELSPYFQGGVLVTHHDNVNTTRRVTWMRAEGATMQELPITLLSLGLDLVEASAIDSTVYGRYADGSLRRATGLASTVDASNVVRLVGDGKHIVWAKDDGTVRRCSGVACTASAPSFIGISLAGTKVDLGYSHEHRRYVAFVQDSSKSLHWGTLPDTGQGTPAAPLVLPQFELEDVLDIAVAGDELYVLTTSKLHVCCVESLEGSAPCEAPVDVVGGVFLTAAPGRVVVQRDDGAYRLSSYGVTRP